MILLIAMLVGQLTYEDALLKAIKDKSPLVVVVGAKWCGPCQVLKKRVEQMQTDGELSVVTYVDIDARPDLAKELMVGKTIPQIIVYSNRSGAWKRIRATGLQTKERILEMIGRAL